MSPMRTTRRARTTWPSVAAASWAALPTTSATPSHRATSPRGAREPSRLKLRFALLVRDWDDSEEAGHASRADGMLDAVPIGLVPLCQRVQLGRERFDLRLGQPQRRPAHARSLPPRVALRILDE